MNAEADAEKKRNAPVDVTPKDRGLGEGKGKDFNWPPNEPKMLNAGKIRNRDEHGRFAKGFVEGNYIPQQKGVEIPSPKLESLEDSLKGLKIVAIDIQKDLEKYH